MKASYIFFLLLFFLAIVPFVPVFAEQDPTIVGRAPFADPDAEKPLLGESSDSLLNLYWRNALKKKTIDALGEAHRTPSQMQEWVVISVSDLLSFSPKKTKEDIKNQRALFQGKAYGQYRETIEKNNLVALISGKYVKINAVVEEDPFLLYEGVRGDKYRWHYEVPVMLTVFDRKTPSHKTREKETRKYVVRVQLTRVPESLRKDGIIIEHWKMEPLRE